MSSTLKSSRTLLIVVLLAVAAAGGVIVGQYFSGADDAELARISLLQPPRPLPPIELIDGNAESFGLEQLRGHWSLLFFGFTHCPDICPNTLGILNATMQQFEQNSDRPAPKVVFVSVDPRRDTPQALAQYVAYFGEDFTGVTGSPEQLTRLTDALYLPFGITENSDGEGYTLEHSAALVLVNPDAQARAYFTPPHQAEGLASDFQSVITAR